jgi:hypothetical protein
MREVLVADVVITNEDVNQLEVVGDLIRHIETVDDYKRRPPPRPDELKEDGPASLGAIRSPAANLPPPTLNNSGMPFGLPDSGAG